MILCAGALYVQPELLGAVFAASAIAAIIKFVTDIIDKSKNMTGAKLRTECAVCGEAMPYTVESFMGEPICDKCRGKNEREILNE